MLPKKLLRMVVEVSDDHTVGALNLEVDATVADRVEVRRAQYIVRRHIAGKVHPHVLARARLDGVIQGRRCHRHDVRRQVGHEVTPHFCAVAVCDVARYVHRRAKLSALHDGEAGAE